MYNFLNTMLNVYIKYYDILSLYYQYIPVILDVLQ